MQLHTLFIDNSVCLYCKGYCDVLQKAIGYPALVIDTYTCRECREEFESNNIDGDYFGFAFTCKDLRLFHNYGSNQFGIDKKNSELKFRDNYIWIPYFDVNFSNKEELYHKLKVYIIFA